MNVMSLLGNQITNRNLLSQDHAMKADGEGDSFLNLLANLTASSEQSVHDLTTSEDENLFLIDEIDMDALKKDFEHLLIEKDEGVKDLLKELFLKLEDILKEVKGSVAEKEDQQSLNTSLLEALEKLELRKEMDELEATKEVDELESLEAPEDVDKLESLEAPEEVDQIETIETREALEVLENMLDTNENVSYISSTITDVLLQVVEHLKEVQLTTDRRSQSSEKQDINSIMHSSDLTEELSTVVKLLSELVAVQKEDGQPLKEGNYQSIQQIYQLFNSLLTHHEGDRRLEKFPHTRHPTHLPVGNKPIYVVNDLEIEKPNQPDVPYDKLIAEIEVMLNNIDQGQNIRTVAPQVLRLLEEWSSTFDAKEMPVIKLNNNLKEATKEKLMTEDIIRSFLARKWNKNNPYQNEAVVTAKNMGKWIEHAMAKYDNQIKTETYHIPTIHSMPMAQIEQHMIYIHPSDSTQTVEKQFMDQFQRAIQTSRFLQGSSGINQLTFHLRPSNLGEMIVKLVEVDGEMTVKMIVSSQATRKILESNIHQLKHMFTPQQVMIEERVLGSHELLESDHEQQLKDEREDLEEQRGQNQKEEKDEAKSFESHFEDFLLNEEV